MDFSLTEDQAAFKALARDFARDEMMPYAEHWDAKNEFPVETMRKAAGLGFGGIYVREETGGAGLGRTDAVLIFEELARACPSTAAYLSIQNMVAWMVDRFGNDEQRRRWGADLCAMNSLASYCLTEPGSGSDSAALSTRATPDGNSHYIVNGSKAFISGAGTSDLYAVMCRTGGEGPSGISCLMVEKDTPGLSFGRPERKLGWRSQPTATVTFENCRVPAENVLGELGTGFRIAMKGLDGGRLNIAACSLGAAQECLDRAMTYMRERKAFGKPIAEFQALRFRIADMLTQLAAGRLLLYHAATQADRDAPDRTATAAMAKLFVTDMGFDVVNQALQLHGGYGYLADFGVERYLRDLRVHQILEGTNEVMRLIISRDAFGKP